MIPNLLLRLFLLYFSTVVAGVSTEQCCLSSLRPEMGPLRGGTNISVQIQCGTSNVTAVRFGLQEAALLFGDQKVELDSVQEAGYVSLHSTG